MKKEVIKYVLVAIVSFFCVTIIYGIVDEMRFSPLERTDFEKLFPDYDGSARKVYQKDFIGLSMHGEFLGLYKYSLYDACISPHYPQIAGIWESKELPNSSFVVKWKPCPMDSIDMKRFYWLVDVMNAHHINEVQELKQGLRSPGNYYCGISTNALETYFLLYDKQSNMMYYIRQNGF